MTLGGNLVDEELVHEEFFIPEDEVAKWKYEKGAKKIERTSKEGFNPNLMLYKPFPLLFSDFRFQFASLCTTNFWGF